MTSGNGFPLCICILPLLLYEFCESDNLIHDPKTISNNSTSDFNHQENSSLDETFLTSRTESSITILRKDPSGMSTNGLTGIDDIFMKGIV